MLNLLFISDSPKIEYVKKALQPMLKVVIDVVQDFDRGLKEVFDKRPATVCIQEHIAGVTGESVARHIQMLLGTGTPTFILIHEGSSKVKQIKGLFEYIIDLSQPEAKLAEEIQSTLKILIGDQWDRLYIPPKQAAASESFSEESSGESRTDADKLVDDFLSDLETSNFSQVVDAVPAQGSKSAITQADSSVVKTTADEFAEMLIDKAHQAGIAAGKSSPDNFGQDFKSKEVPKPEPTEKSSAPNVTKPPVAPDNVPKPNQTGSAAPGEKQTAAPVDEKVVEIAKSVGVITKVNQDVSVSIARTPPFVPAEFRINNEMSTDEEQSTDDFLPAFEENYRLESNSMKRVIIAAFVLLFFVALGGWYFVKRNPDILAPSKQRATTVNQPIPAPVVSLPSPAVQPVPIAQKPAQTKAHKTSLPAILPAFIPREGLDESYAAKNPGWERYIGKQSEFRVFSDGGKIKAVQILATAANVIPDSLVKTVLTELTGSKDYQIASKTNESGFLVLRGSAAKKTAVIFYTKESDVLAFVVSLN
jgi:hypothetical protein